MRLADPADIETADRVVQHVKAWIADPTTAPDLVLPHVASRVVRKYIEGEFPLVAFWHRGKTWTASRGGKAPDDAADRLAAYVGFRSVFKMLVAAKKPIVGHNVLMDILFLISSVDKAIPSDLRGLRAYMADAFPEVWDTKILATCSDEVESMFESTSLQNIFTTFTPDGVLRGITLPLGFERYTDVLKNRQKRKPTVAGLAHEAAYDALCTGYVYLQLREALAANGPLLASCRNVLAVFKSLHAIDLSVNSSRDVWLPRGPVLALTYPASVTDLEVQSSLAPLKGKISWPEEGTAVALLETGQDTTLALAHYANNTIGIAARVVNSQSLPIRPIQPPPPPLIISRVAVATAASLEAAAGIAKTPVRTFLKSFFKF